MPSKGCPADVHLLRAHEHAPECLHLLKCVEHVEKEEIHKQFAKRVLKRFRGRVDNYVFRRLDPHLKYERRGR